MNLYDLTNYLVSVLQQDQRLHSVFQDDVYDTWNKHEVPFMSAVIDMYYTSFNGDYVDVYYYLYVGDVQNREKTNTLQIKSLADSVITQFLHKIDVETSTAEGINLIVPVTCNFFEQAWENVVAGEYCQFGVRVPIDIICEE